MASSCGQSCDRSSCEGCPSAKKPQDLRAPQNGGSHIKHVIGIVSGKGGVGKSSVTTMLAVYLNRQGYKVGVLDADITGPSIPCMLGVTDIQGVEGEEMVPAITATGIKVISINLLLQDTTQPVIWRGPVIAGVVKQFWSEVIWGELDYLLVDMPPGTGDVALTVFQSLPVDGVVIVSSPQSLVEMVVKKAYNMAVMMKIPVLGVVENFSYTLCPDCGRRIELFGRSHVEAWCKESKVPFLAQLPLDPNMAEYADAGRMEAYLCAGMSAVAAVLPKE